MQHARGCRPLTYYTRPDTQHAQLRRRPTPDAAPVKSQVRPTEQTHPTTQLQEPCPRCCADLQVGATVPTPRHPTNTIEARCHTTPPNTHRLQTHARLLNTHTHRKDPPPHRRRDHPPREVNPTTIRRRPSPKWPIRTEGYPPPPRRRAHPPKEVNPTTTRRRPPPDTQSAQQTTIDLHPTTSWNMHHDTAPRPC